MIRQLLKIIGEKHELKVDEIDLTNRKVKVTISSEPITLEMYVGETEKVDVDSDGVYDLSVYLESIRGSFVDIIIKEISETIEKLSEAENKIEVEEDVPEEKSEDKNFVWIYVLIGIIIVGVCFGLLRRK